MREIFSNLLFLLFLKDFFVDGCENGLTQLRQRATLNIMKCVPTLQGQADPCVIQTGGRMAFCQKDRDGDDFVCCGTTALLIELIAPNSNLQTRSIDPSNYYKDSNSAMTVLKQEYKTVRRALPQMSLPSQSPVILQKSSHMKKYFKTNLSVMRSPITLSLLSSPVLRSAGPNSWETKPAVILLQDGICNVLVNTGLPAQGPEIVEALATRGVAEARFMVATSSHMQFTGNLNLYPRAQIIVGRWHARDTIMTRWNTGKGYRMDLCSSSIYTVPTPGPSDDSITVFAANVPAMGTVAIVGLLFAEAEPLDRTSTLWVASTATTLQSRKMVVCSADWIQPAYGMPFPVTPQMRKEAGCSKHLI
ncbi:unnamed protein product, partial [Mesorhabditis belari]|uniref:Uncharacterized protein n=1 Tax=Mesorhabditis belari TaxID=2138241 RepID=A0AAF3EIN2_9BILA